MVGRRATKNNAYTLVKVMMTENALKELKVKENLQDLDYYVLEQSNREYSPKNED